MTVTARSRTPNSAMSSILHLVRVNKDVIDKPILDLQSETIEPESFESLFPAFTLCAVKAIFFPRSL